MGCEDHIAMRLRAPRLRAVRAKNASDLGSFARHGSVFSHNVVLFARSCQKPERHWHSPTSVHSVGMNA